MKLQWNQIDWEKAEEQVNRLQVRIVKATLEQKWRLVKRLQYLMTNSFYAKALAVKRVVSNKGKKTPGIDGELWETDKAKMEAVRRLDCKTYHASPLKRIYIEKYGKKEKRPLGIPTMFDRAMQALQLLALEPVAETTADRISFGFRRCRSPEDAREYAFSVLSRKDSPQWILEGDIKSCFDKISHQWMLENIPADRRILKEFMKCGYIDKGQLFPTTEGSPQGGVISPTYANMVLDGMEPMILDVYWRSRVKKTFSVKYNKNKVHMVRFADDFIVTASDKGTLEEIKAMIEKFLEQRGLALSMEKTVITHINDGFDFLGWNFRKFKGKLIIKPSHKSMSRITEKISGVIKDNRTATQETLICKLNEVIVGWANYHHSTCAKRSFGTIDHRIWEMLWKWSKRRHPNKSKGWIVRKYWKTHKGRKWTFMSDKNILFLMMDMPIVRKGQMALDKNPFLDPGYFEHRAKKHRLDRKKAICSNRAAQIGYYAL
ncbi:group II intron reverse transcriptase/maturase [uncultured Bacteroides sp.]|uniref:group II intron reverse transcriptase/maturase n=1 Tax=uncultured Bacteroides sp. TaxID=162156 RepID=UPI002593324E|nr:group II intron reverse transcriptase/maturase [uncultured Bacteroides sp.]